METLSIKETQHQLASTDRVLSIDVFRGATMLVMIFANDLDMAEIQNVPNWMKHVRLAVPSIPRELIDSITFVDMIAGAFIFIVGVAIPLAMRRRQEKGQPAWKTLGHVLLRTVSLLIMGVLTGAMRSSKVDPIGISHAAWSCLMLVGLMLVWNQYPKATGRRQGVFIAMRLAGLTLLVGLVCVYRRHSGDQLIGMNYTNWFVLGSIGWAYLLACGVYVLFGRRIVGVTVCTGLFVLVWIADHEGILAKIHLLDGIRRFVSLGTNIGAHAATATAGMMVGMLFMDNSPAKTPARRIQWMAVLGAFALLAGALLRPIYRLAKSGNTPTCTLYTIAICCVIYAVLYWIIDVRGYRRWVSFTLPAGRNPLLPYFLHYMIHPLSVALGFAWLNDYLNVGLVGITRTGGVTVLLGMVLTILLTRAYVRPRL